MSPSSDDTNLLLTRFDAGQTSETASGKATRLKGPEVKAALAVARSEVAPVDVLDVPPLHVLGVDGSGAPADPSFGEAGLAGTKVPTSAYRRVTGCRSSAAGSGGGLASSALGGDDNGWSA